VIAEADARAWIAAYGDAWVRRDPDRVVQLFTADATYQERRFRPALKGTAAMHNYWQVIVHDLQRDNAFEVGQIVVSGEQAFIAWNAHFTWRPINGILELDALSRITFSTMTGGDGLRLARDFEEWIDSREA
jgi:ketosteroid isomerase-like protein